jgi:hypothetical protein
MNLCKLNAKNKNTNLYNRFYILFIDSQRKWPKIDIWNKYLFLTIFIPYNINQFLDTVVVGYKNFALLCNLCSVIFVTTCVFLKCFFLFLKCFSLCNGSPELPLVGEAPARTRSAQHPHACDSHVSDRQYTICVRQYKNAYIWINVHKPCKKESSDARITWNEYDTVFNVYDCIKTCNLSA